MGHLKIHQTLMLTKHEGLYYKKEEDLKCVEAKD